MDAVVIELVRGKDHKRYPAGLPRPRAEVNRLRWLAHELVCGQGLSYRAAQREMLRGHGIRRSLGAIWGDVTRFECWRCAAPAGQAASDG